MGELLAGGITGCKVVVLKYGDGWDGGEAGRVGPGEVKRGNFFIVVRDMRKRYSACGGESLTARH